MFPGVAGSHLLLIFNSHPQNAQKWAEVKQPKTTTERRCHETDNSLFEKQTLQISKELIVVAQN